MVYNEKQDKFLVYEYSGYDILFLKETYRYYYEYSIIGTNGRIYWSLYLSDRSSPEKQKHYLEALQKEGLLWG